MPLKTNITNLKPARQVYKQEITLLSKGYYNKQAFPEGKITVYPWDTDIEEWFLKRLRKPNKNRALWELSAKLAELNGCPYEDLTVGDVNTILLVARSIQRKNVVQFTSICPRCDHPDNETLKIPDELVKVAEKEANYPGYDEIVLPESKDIVRLRPLQIKDEILITDRSPKNKAELSDELAHQLIPIVSIGGGQPDNIQELVTWWHALHPLDKKYYETQQNELWPHLETSVRLRCSEC